MWLIHKLNDKVTPKFGGAISALGRIGSFKDKSRLSTSSLESSSKRVSHQNGSVDPKGDFVNNSVQGLNKFSLYVLGEKTQMKVQYMAAILILNLEL